ncbi:MAG: aquaporin [Elusimicrobiota bacterium]
MAGNLRAFLAELMGTFAWVLFVAGAVCTDASLDGALGPAGIAMAQGVALAAVFGVFGPYSIGLFNPAFTIALACLKRVEIGKAALCLLCQLLGAVLAALLLKQIFSHLLLAGEPPYLGTPLASAVGFRSATLLEAVITFFLAVAAYRATEDTGMPSVAPRAIVVGAVAAAAAFVAGPLTGAAMNPARAFGPAVVTGFWSQHYVYWVGPLAGAVGGMALSRFLFDR